MLLPEEPGEPRRHRGLPLSQNAALSHVHSVFTNKLLTDSPLWIRRMASASRGAIERTVMLGRRFSGGTGTVLVVTISAISGWARRRSMAGPQKRPWVQAMEMRRACRSP